MAMSPVSLSADPLDQSWYEASARARLDALVDPGTFEEFLGPEQRVMSPHLPAFDLPRAFDDGIVVGRGTPRRFARPPGRAGGAVHGRGLRRGPWRQARRPAAGRARR